jgi:hypothetical protein
MILEPRLQKVSEKMQFNLGLMKNEKMNDIRYI